MKKIVMASILATVAFAASAVEVSAVSDRNLDKNGFRVGAEVVGLNVSATHVDDRYNRYAVGKSFELTKVGPVALSASVAAVYQDTNVGKDGYGLTAGAKATLPVTKSLDVVAGVERFVGQERVKSFNGNVATLGVAYKF